MYIWYTYIYTCIAQSICVYTYTFTYMHTFCRHLGSSVPGCGVAHFCGLIRLAKMPNGGSLHAMVDDVVMPDTDILFPPYCTLIRELTNNSVQLRRLMKQTK